MTHRIHRNRFRARTAPWLSLLLFVGTLFLLPANAAAANAWAFDAGTGTAAVTADPVEGFSGWIVWPIFTYDEIGGTYSLNGCDVCSSPPDDVSLIEVNSPTPATFGVKAFPSSRTDGAVIPVELNIAGPGNGLSVSIGTPYLTGTRLIEGAGDHLRVYHDGVMVTDVHLNVSSLSKLELQGTSGADVVDLRNLTTVVSRIDIATAEGADTITLPPTGSSGVISAGTGSDTVNARATHANVEVMLDSGNDTYLGSQGRDDVYGGWGEDAISTYDGRDYVRGGPNADDIRLGSGGDDVAYGEGGNDVIYAGLGSTSDAHADTLEGGSGNDKLVGGSGADNLRGRSGDDAMFGNGGTDNLTDWEGANSFSGGPGQDDIWAGTSRQGANDRINCGRGAKDATRYLYRSHRYCELYKNWTDPGGPFWLHY